MTEETQCEIYIYLGQDQGKGGKRLGSWLPITKEQLDTVDLPSENRVCHYLLKSSVIRASPMRGASPGQVYEIEATKDSIIPGSAKYQRMWPDDDQVVQWEARDRSIRAVLDLRDRKKKDAKVDRMLERLQPLNDAYNEAVGLQRTMLLAMVVERVTKRPKR